MVDIPTRRDFIKGLAAGGALCGLPAFSETLPAAGGETAAGKPAATPFDHNVVEAEVRRRAQEELHKRRLVVDYYRIGRKIAYPLPVLSLSIPNVPVPGIKGYPWSIWLLWTLEERVVSLGWTAEWLGDHEARRAATADLAALAQWPKYRQLSTPDLASAHAGRILWRAATQWKWPDEDLQDALREACRRHVEDVLPTSDKMFASVSTKDDVLRHDSPHKLLQNIPLIGTIGAALTASAVQHAAAAHLNARVAALFGAILDLRTKGFTEGVAYDGYVLDFIADWLGTLPAAERSAILDHPNLKQYLDECCLLGAPGAIEQVAELSDVEPREMPFRLSAQAKLLRFRPLPVAAWLLARCRLDWLRSDALAALHQLKIEPPASEPPSGALDAHYAAVLRSGWEADNLAVAVACSNSPMDHIQSDNGTLVIGTRGNWLITDPGYQQYAKGDERDFTVGPAAHNAPLLNGIQQTLKQPRRVALENIAPGVSRVAIDLAACYPPSLALKTLVRQVWLADDNLVVVADRIEAETPPQATYHWHANPACAWWLEADWALIVLDEVQLWFTSPQAQLSGANLQRLPGSRGQLSLIPTIDEAPSVVWWAFVISQQRPVMHLESQGRQLRILDRVFRVE